VYTATKKQRGKTGWFSFAISQRRVTCYYFPLCDEDFGSAFVKVCAYFPYPMKIWLNGHEWAKRQAGKAGIGFAELSDGFATCTDPAALQEICDRLGSDAIRVFAQRWWSILPLSLTEHDRAAGYWWELSMRQIEASRTLVLDAPRRARAFFEALVADNLDIGRPQVIELIFKRGQRRGRPAEGEYKTTVVTYGTEVNVNAFYRHSRIKPYLKDGRALRIETVVNDTEDLGCRRRGARGQAPQGPPATGHPPACRARVLNWSRAFGYLGDTHQPERKTAPPVKQAYADILASASLSKIYQVWNAQGITPSTASRGMRRC
jgi:hypothetical protein